jgi:undecaprenyl diphosphate synthase
MDLKHLAIILDGNRRWARSQGLPTLEGHRRGYDNVKTIGVAAIERGIKHFTVFAFSTENWKRSAEEVSYLMDLLYLLLTTEIDFLRKHDVRLQVIGRREGLSEKIQKAIVEAEAATASHSRGQFNVCINYGGRAEIVDAVKAIISEGHRPEEITEEFIASKIWMAGIPDVDLWVRTSGEQRLSGFLTWSSTYAELLFVEKHWPAFSIEDLDAAIAEFHDRERRFGK